MYLCNEIEKLIESWVDRVDFREARIMALYMVAKGDKTSNSGLMERLLLRRSRFARGAEFIRSLLEGTSRGIGVGWKKKERDGETVTERRTSLRGNCAEHKGNLVAVRAKLTRMETPVAAGVFWIAAPFIVFLLDWVALNSRPNGQRLWFKSRYDVQFCLINSPSAGRLPWR